MTKPVLFSGIQPSGQFMIGNYIGAIQPSATMQNTHDCLFCLVDLHAITVRQDPEKFRSQVLDALSLYIAGGLDPKQSILFLQSHVPQHAELAWILNCFTQMGQLSRMTQFKDKSQQHAHNINAGLFTYPALMAADILLYQTELITVGDDQKQHLELTRDLAKRFNHYHGDIFTEPDARMPSQGARIMSLQDPSKKMSKSDPNENGVIRLLDPPELVEKKLKRSVTDSENNITYNPENQPGVSNLLILMSACSGNSIEHSCEQLQGKGYGALKTHTADAINQLIAPIQDKYSLIRQDESTLLDILKHGAEQASIRASDTLSKVKKALGMIVI